ncbi:MAG: hypothetical protein J5748_00890 [Bacteroidales bacterium]|nr:hypothetical protein [Bacteroidales bacterium]
MYYVNYPTGEYDTVLDVLSHSHTNSIKISSIPLADFWHPNRNLKHKEIISKKINTNLIDANYCFEYPTPAYQEGNSGKTLPYSKSSMTDLMILLPETQITIEAKYTEYVRDKAYKPLLKEWCNNQDHKKKIIDCWLRYISSYVYEIQTSDELLNVESLPYQFLHRTASACFARNGAKPILVYQLFYDEENVDQLNKFEELLRSSAQTLKLNLDKLPFYIIKQEVAKIKMKNGKENSFAFDRMKIEPVYVFDAMPTIIRVK